jgi:hypothetical protein
MSMMAIAKLGREIDKNKGKVQKSGGLAAGKTAKDFTPAENLAILRGAKMEAAEHGSKRGKPTASDHVVEHGKEYYNNKGLPSLESKLGKSGEGEEGHGAAGQVAAAGVKGGHMLEGAEKFMHAASKAAPAALKAGAKVVGPAAEIAEAGMAAPKAWGELKSGNVVGAMGTMAPALGGFAGGALGAAAGSAVAPGIGTAVGGVAGSMAGGAIGEKFNKWAHADDAGVKAGSERMEAPKALTDTIASATSPMGGLRSPGGGGQGSSMMAGGPSIGPSTSPAAPPSATPATPAAPTGAGTEIASTKPTEKLAMSEATKKMYLMAKSAVLKKAVVKPERMTDFSPNEAPAFHENHGFDPKECAELAKRHINLALSYEKGPHGKGLDPKAKFASADYHRKQADRWVGASYKLAVSTRPPAQKLAKKNAVATSVGKAFGGEEPPPPPPPPPKEDCSSKKGMDALQCGIDQSKAFGKTEDPALRAPRLPSPDKVAAEKAESRDLALETRKQGFRKLLPAGHPLQNPQALGKAPVATKSPVFRHSPNANHSEFWSYDRPALEAHMKGFNPSGHTVYPVQEHKDKSGKTYHSALVRHQSVE